MWFNSMALDLHMQGLGFRKKRKGKVRIENEYVLSGLPMLLQSPTKNTKSESLVQRIGNNVRYIDQVGENLRSATQANWTWNVPVDCILALDGERAWSCLVGVF